MVTYGPVSNLVAPKDPMIFTVNLQLQLNVPVSLTLDYAWNLNEPIPDSEVWYFSPQALQNYTDSHQYIQYSNLACSKLNIGTFIFIIEIFLIGTKRLKDVLEISCFECSSRSRKANGAAEPGGFLADV